MNNNTPTNKPAAVAMLPDGTYVGAIGTLDVVGGKATLRASSWSDAEDGRHGHAPAASMSAETVALYGWWRDGVGYGTEA